MQGEDEKAPEFLLAMYPAKVGQPRCDLGGINGFRDIVLNIDPLKSITLTPLIFALARRHGRRNVEGCIPRRSVGGISRMGIALFNPSGLQAIVMRL